MKKLSLVVFALAMVAAFSVNSFAKQGLSVGLGVGMMGNAGGLGGTITNDGLGKTMTAGLSNDANGMVPILDNLTLIESEKSLLDAQTKSVLAGNTNTTGVKTSGAMNVIDLQFQARYDFLGYLFARTGFNYGMKISGGETSWVQSGKAQKQTWDYNHMVVPVTLGINVAVADKFNAYAGLTAAYVSGGWSVDISRTYFASDSGTLQTAFAPAFTANPGGVATEKIEFEASGISFGYLAGVSAEVYDNVSVFVEMETIVYADYDEHKIKNAPFKTYGLTHFNKFVVVGGSTMRFGASYALGF